LPGEVWHVRPAPTAPPLGAAAHLCQAEVDLIAAGYPELVAKLEEVRAVIDLEIAYLEADDLSRPRRAD
jgi:hypothetical protein